MTNTALTVNIDDALSFLESYEESLRITFQIYDDKKITRRAEHFTGDLNDVKLQEYLMSANQAGLGVYFMANAGDGHGRSIENVTHIRSLVADLDGAPLEPVYQCALEPHYIIESSPGRYQCHWLIEPVAIESFAGGRAEAINKVAAWQVSLGRKFQGDESVKDLCRVFRVPGFYHLKGEPFRTHIVQSNRGLPYSLERVIKELNLSETIEQVQTELKEKLSEVDALIPGKIKVLSRHRTLLAYGCKYSHQYNLGYFERKWLLEGLNKHACEAPIEAHDLERINIQSGKYAAQARAAYDTVDISALIERHKAVSEKPADVLPEHLLSPPGLLGEVLRYMIGSAQKPQPEIALAGALVACATIMGRKVKTVTNIRTNIYCLAFGATGSGKDWPRQAMKKIFAKIGKSERACIEEAASDAAISESLTRVASQAFLFDEFGKMMATIGNRNAGAHLTNIPTLMMKLYSSSGQPFNTKAYADAKFNHVIQQPNVSMLATSTEENFWNAISRDAVSDGLLNRMLFLKSTEADPIIRKIRNQDPPDSIVEQFRAWEEMPYRQSGNLADLEDGPEMKPDPRVVDYGEGAEEVFDEMEADLRNVRKELRKDGMAGLFTRAYENAHKVALIVACGRSRENPSISIDDAEYGCSLVTFVMNSILREVRAKVSNNRVEASHKALLQIIKESGAEGITKKDVGRGARNFGLQKKDRESILAELAEWGYIAIQQQPSATNTATRYFFVGDDASSLK